MQDIRGKRLLLLGSSVWKDLIKSFAEYYGVRLYFAGLYPAPLDDIVEEYYRIDTTDPEVMIPFVKEHQFDGVYMGGSEFIVSHACTWINQLGLPCYCEKEQWDILQDKARFKDLCIEHGLPVVPKFTIDPANISGSVPGDEYPVITKPTDGSGSNGFSVCRNAEELDKGYKAAADCSPTGSVICEKFVNNNGLVVFFTFSRGKMHFVMTEDKTPVKYEKQGSYVAGLFTCPSKSEALFKSLYEKKLKSLFSSIGIREGTIWIEIFKDGDNFYFNEVGYRYGGSFSFYSVDYLSGINQFFADFVHEAHEKGIRVIIDGVFNHCGSFNKWLDRERIYEDAKDYEKGAYISADSPYRSYFSFSLFPCLSLPPLFNFLPLSLPLSSSCLSVSLNECFHHDFACCLTLLLFF